MKPKKIKTNHKCDTCRFIRREGMSHWYHCWWTKDPIDGNKQGCGYWTKEATLKDSNKDKRG